MFHFVCFRADSWSMPLTSGDWVAWWVNYELCYIVSQKPKMSKTIPNRTHFTKVHTILLFAYNNYILPTVFVCPYTGFIWNHTISFYGERQHFYNIHCKFVETFKIRKEHKAWCINEIPVNILLSFVENQIPQDNPVGIPLRDGIPRHRQTCRACVVCSDIRRRKTWHYSQDKNWY